MGYDAGLRRIAQDCAGLRRTAQVKAPGAEAERLLGLFLKETERISKSGTPDHPGLKPQGAADFGRFGLWRAPAAPGGVPEDAPRRAVHFGIKITQIGLLWPEFRQKSEIWP